jgi:beta-ribofuranosylaminobenzene 5'-phosphate synthase
MLDQPNITLEVTNDSNELKIDFDTPYDGYIQTIKEKTEDIKSALKIKNQGFHFKIKEYYPEHLGIGSKTQLSLAIGTAISKLEGIDVPIEKITKIVGRGGTSGIGWRGFEQGGFILDGGHDFGKNKEKETFLPSSASNSANPALTLIRYPIPENWRFIEIFPNVKKGAYGEEEVNVFQEFTPINQEEVNEISHQILMKILPGLIRNDLDCFGQGLNRIQKIGFKKIEIELQHPLIKKLMKFLENERVKAYAMSSFGPCVVAITEDDESAEILKTKCEEFIKDIGGTVLIAKPNNTGAVIKIEE